MPIVSAADAVFAKVPPGVEVLLPDVDEIAADTSVLGLFGILGARYSTRAATIWQQSSQVSLASLLTNVGIPIKRIFEVTLDVMDIDVVAEVTSGLEAAYGSLRDAYKSMTDAAADGGEALASAVEVGAAPAVDLASAVPIVGWIIKVVWNLGKAIFNIAKLAKEANKEAAKAIYPASVFNPEFDNLVVNDVISRMRNTRDWGRMFGPPSLGEGPGTLGPMSVRLLDDGVEIVRREAQEWGREGWTGMVPGTGWLHQGIQVRQVNVIDLGELLLPSTRTLGLWFWKNVMGKGGTVSPSMYCVDFRTLDWWRSYIYDFHKFIYETDYLNQANKQRVIDLLNKDASGLKIFGWGSKIKPEENETDHYQPAVENEILRERQFLYLDTLMCAYVDESYVAIDSDPILKDVWKARRNQLLQHPARCDVDLNNVPDATYREALRESGVGYAVCHQASMQLAVKGFQAGFDAPEGQQGAAGVGDGTPGRRLSPAVPILALGAAGVAAWKAGLFSKLPKLKI